MDDFLYSISLREFIKKAQIHWITNKYMLWTHKLLHNFQCVSVDTDVIHVPAFSAFKAAGFSLNYVYLTSLSMRINKQESRATFDKTVCYIVWRCPSSLPRWRTCCCRWTGGPAGRACALSPRSRGRTTSRWGRWSDSFFYPAPEFLHFALIFTFPVKFFIWRN